MTVVCISTMIMYNITNKEPCVIIDMCRKQHLTITVIVHTSLSTILDHLIKHLPIPIFYIHQVSHFQHQG
jgi:hypothetical protein